MTECPAGMTGEIWVYGDNVALGYWQKPMRPNYFRCKACRSVGRISEGPWLRTGDQGVLFDDELLIIGRIKDLLIVYGRNDSSPIHPGDDQEMMGGGARRSPSDTHTRDFWC